MKKYLLKIALFFAIIAVFDFTFGKVCNYLRDQSKGGFSGNVHYICEKCNEDIIMMGSSRMRHHYVPQVFEDSLAMTCYNAGIDGNGIILNYGFLEMILKRYSPKLIIYDVSGFDMYVDDNTKYLDMLKPYYEKKGIAGIFDDVNPSEKWKMLSGMYRYNSKLLGLVGDNIHPSQSFDKGYWPSHKVMNYVPDSSKYNNSSIEVDSLKMAYLQKFVTLAKDSNVPIVFTVSPKWFSETRQDYYAPIKELCTEEKVPFLNYCYDLVFRSQQDNWADPTHLNDKGAKLYSQKIIKDIKSIINHLNN